MKTSLFRLFVVFLLMAVSVVGLYWLFNGSSRSMLRRTSTEQESTNTKTTDTTQIPTQVLRGFSFLDQDGKPFSAEMLKDKTVLLNFAYTSCGSVCPTVIHDLGLVQKRLPESYLHHIMFVTISVDPQHDSPEKIRKFMSQMKVDTRNWSWLVADQKTTQRLVKHMRVFDPRKKDPTVNDHRTDLILINKEGQVIQTYQSQALQTERLAQELMRLDDFTRAAPAS